MSRKPKVHTPLGVSFGEALTAISDERKPAEITSLVKPFLKWVGGKRSILPELVRRLPPSYKTYYEPFLGGGALFFSVKPENARLSDVNFHLVITFKAVRDDVEGLVKALKVHASRHDKDYFLNARKRLFLETDPLKIAALFVYLNKSCYNGLYRVNKAGQFNVPLGDYKDPPILDEVNLRICSEALRDTEIAQHDFSQVEPRKDCFYYMDPPYHQTFSNYAGGGFDEAQHKNLAALCGEIDQAGGFFMLSNADTEFVRGLYKGFTVETVSASRSVSCKGDQRGKEQELIVRNYK